MRIAFFLATLCATIAFAQEIAIPEPEIAVPAPDSAVSEPDSVVSEPIEPIEPKIAIPAPDSAVIEPKPKEEALAEAAKAVHSDKSLDWRYWARVASYTLGMACVSVAMVKHRKASEHDSNIKKLKNDMNRVNWKQNRKEIIENADNVKKYEIHRDIYIGGVGALFLAGTLTLFF